MDLGFKPHTVPDSLPSKLGYGIQKGVNYLKKQMGSKRGAFLTLGDSNGSISIP